MGRWKEGASGWREPYRKVSKTLSLPKNLVELLDAHKNMSASVTEILEQHYERIGAGFYQDLVQRRKEKLSLIVESILKTRLPEMVRDCIEEAVDEYLKE